MFFAAGGLRMVSGKQMARYANGHGTGPLIPQKALIKLTKMVRQKNPALMGHNAIKIKSAKIPPKALALMIFAPKVSDSRRAVRRIV